MDLPHLIHHRHHHHHQQNPRYVPLSPPPTYPHPHYPDDPNFQNPRPPNHHHPHHYHPPVPPQPPAILHTLPPPQSSSYHPFPPTPPPYNPSQSSKFAFSNPNHNLPFEDDRSRQLHHHRDFAVLANRASSSHRLPVDDDHPHHHRYSEIRTDFWDQYRVVAENRPERPYTPLGFESDPHKLQFDHKHMSPYRIAEKFRHDTEGISRIRGEYDDGFEPKYREEIVWGREDEKYYRGGQFLSGSDTSFRELGFVSDPVALSRDSELNSRSNDGRYGLVYDDELFRSGNGDGVRENPRWGHDRKHNSWFERGNVENGFGDGAPIEYGKHEYYGSELGRYSNRGSRDGSHEYNCTPRKQLQKKSALLRIQMAKPHRRSAESRQLHYSGYLDNSGSSSFRRKDHQDVYMSHGMDEDEREGSPVELDVSFKSNALVAKAIVAPSSSSDVIDADLTFRNRKVMKDSVSDVDIVNSELTDLSEDTVNMQYSTHCANSTSTSDKELIKSEVKVTSGVGNNCLNLKHSKDTVNLLGSTNVANTSTSDIELIKSEGKITSGIKNNCLNSELTKLSEDALNLHSSIHVANSTSTSDNELIKSEGKCTSGIKNIYHDSSRACYGIEISPKGTARSSLVDDNLKVEHQCFGSSIFEELMFPSVQPLCSSGSERLQKKDDASVMPVNNHQIDDIDIKCKREEKLGVCASKEQLIIHDEIAQSTILSAFQPPDIDQRLPCTSTESDDSLVKDNLPCMSNYRSLSADCSGVSASTSNDELMEIDTDTLSDMSSPQTSFNVSDTPGLDGEVSLSQISNDICRNDKNLDEKSVVDGGSDVSAQISLSQCSKINLKSDHGSEVLGKTVPLPLKDSKSMFSGLNIVTAEDNGRKNQAGHTLPRIFPGHASSIYSMIKKTASSTHAKPRTWHRSGNSSASSVRESDPFTRTVPSKRQLPERDGIFQSSSYVRKGNSLVRKPSLAAPLPKGSHDFSSSVYRLNSVGIDELKKGTVSDRKVDIGNPSRLSRTGGMNAYFDRPKTSLLTNSTKLPNSTAILLGDCMSSLQAEPFNSCSETTSDPMRSSENNGTPKFAEDSLRTSEALENQNGQPNSFDNQTELNDGTLASSNMKRIVYVKRKSNQLVATSNSSDLSIPNDDKIQPSSFDGYYKRRKNQLIRTSFEGQTRQTVVVPDNLNSEVQGASKAISIRFNKRRSHKDVAKSSKPSKNSLVWTLCSTESSKNHGGSVDHQKVFRHLFPWKREAYWRSFMHNRNLFSKNSSLSVISRKLLLSRKRDAVYTRSTNGFSLRKSKVLSVGRSSLKWSKSIERRSKNANEEATLAVAEVERKKREQNQAANPGSKNRNKSPRERIFRIGSVRYKMDPSRRTLQRISDDESSCSVGLHPDKEAKISYIPRRLVIGNDEYIRIGNGNQLIRNPKKRTRILASAKVRWSLHTTRLRLARKRKYCQFFTRFGKCNKEDGKCPYIHDPSKVAVCTKFLNGLCFNTNCKLTHKVIPERMPDCCYFLQGLCTNQNCPYRHVNVNPKASTCEEFLRGYCADGNECRKKHSYVCPTFEATGTCPQGSKCKLHHPKKNRTRERKGNSTGGHKNVQGRYFGSMHVNVVVPMTAVSEKLSTHDIASEGKFADFIGIDVSDDEAGESNDRESEQTTLSDSDLSQFQLHDLDELIKPVRIMDKNLMTLSFLDHGSSNVK